MFSWLDPLLRYIDSQEFGPRHANHYSPRSRYPAVDIADDILSVAARLSAGPLGPQALDPGPMGRWSFGGRWLASDARSRDLS
jgi:hypothetical protein